MPGKKGSDPLLPLPRPGQVGDDADHTFHLHQLRSVVHLVFLDSQ